MYQEVREGVVEGFKSPAVRGFSSQYGVWWEYGVRESGGSVSVVRGSSLQYGVWE